MGRGLNSNVKLALRSAPNGSICRLRFGAGRNGGPRSLGCRQRLLMCRLTGLRISASRPQMHDVRVTGGMTMREEYLIWSNEHRLWWRAGAHGYTSDIGKAGRYSREEALRHSSGRDQVPGEPLPELPVRVDDVLCLTRS